MKYEMKNFGLYNVYRKSRLYFVVIVVLGYLLLQIIQFQLGKRFKFF